MKRRITAIVKPTHECNLACRYCYVEEKAERGRMDSKTLENMTKSLSELPNIEKVHIIWHGGEPLLMGLNFYEESFNIQRRYSDVKFENSMQSNATLVNDCILDFCENYNVHIGTSLDGPEEIHNLTRIYPDGRGSFQDVWKGIKKIMQRNEEIKKRTKDGKKRMYLGGGAITIMNRLNIQNIDKIYEFFKANNLSMKINPLIKSGRAVGEYEDLGIGAAEYGQALVGLFDRWFYEKETGIDVDPLSDILGNLMTGKPVGCNFGESCRFGFVSIGPLGDVYPCGRFDGIKEYWLGNINERGIFEMLESRKHKIMFKRSRETVAGCSTCDYGGICNAGCMHNAYMQRGKLEDKDYYCASYKILFRHLQKALSIELEKARVEEEEEEFAVLKADKCHNMEGK